MSTTKTIKIQKNKILTYSINKSGFQTVNKTITVTGDTTITEELVSQTGSPIQALGDRLFGISTFFMYFTPSGEYDKDSLKYITASQTTGTGLTNIQVVKSLWLAQIETVLSIETPKGTSNTFTFTYNGSTWDLTGATTQSAISTQNLADVYGVSFSGTAVSGNVITVVETQYNKFAVYVLDSNYRGMYKWRSSGSELNFPIQYTSNPQDCIESATYFNDYLFDTVNLADYPLFDYTKNLGNFILPNGIKINALIPNGAELKNIWINRVALDSFDPVIQTGGTDYNLTNWNFMTGYKQYVWTCLECYANNAISLNENGEFMINSSTQWYDGTYKNNPNLEGCCPIFEVPVM